MKQYEISVEFYPVPEEAVDWATIETASFDLVLSWVGERVFGSAVVKSRTESLAFGDFQLLAFVAGLSVKKVDLGLVSTSEIAEELNSSRETVRLWAEGKRRAGFPQPFATVGGSNIWAWSDVYDWARKQVGLEVSDFTPLSLNYVEKMNVHLAQGLDVLKIHFLESLKKLPPRDPHKLLFRYKDKAGFFDSAPFENALGNDKVS